MKTLAVSIVFFAPVEGVYDLRTLFDKAKKTNLHETIFKDHGHNLNFNKWLIIKEIPKGDKEEVRDGRTDK